MEVNKTWKYIITAYSFLIVLVIFTDIIPKAIAIFDLSFQCIHLYLSSDEQQDAKLILPALLAKNKRLKSEINGEFENYEKTKNISTVISLIDKISIKTNTDISSIKPKDIIEKDNIRFLPIEIIASSTYENFFNYVKQLESNSKIITIKSILLTPTKVLSENLECKINIEVYLNI